MAVADQSTRPPRLLFVVNAAWFFLSHRLALAIAARDAGYDVHVAAQVYSEEERRQIKAANLVLHEVEIPRSTSGIWANFALLCRFVSLYRRVRPTIVHQVTMKPNVLGGCAARITGVPAVVYAISGLGFAFTSKGFIAGARRIVLKSVMRFAMGHRNSRVIFQNPDDLRLLVDADVVNAGSAVLIRGAGVDVSDFPLSAEVSAPVRVLLATRLLREKGVVEFVEAARALSRVGIRAEFLLAGKVDTDNPSSLPQSEVELWHDAGLVRWLGHVSPIGPLLAAVHIVVLPSYYGEGVPRILIEAAAAGRAIVTTDTPGCREIVLHEINGLLVPPRDIEALASAIRRLVDEPETRRRMGLAGRKRVASGFSLQEVIRQTLKEYGALRS